MISKLVILKGSAWNSNTSDTYTYQDVSYVIVVYSHMLTRTFVIVHHQNSIQFVLLEKKTVSDSLLLVVMG